MTEHLSVPPEPSTNPADYETGVLPISSVLAPCLDDDGSQPYADRGICRLCGSKVATRSDVVTPTYKTWRTVPHLRWQHTFAVTDAAECSCGGWQGTPVSIERQLTGAETLILSFQGKVDDIEHNQAQSVDLLCQLNERLDKLIELLSERR